MAQIGIAGVSAALPFVTGPSPSEVPSRRVQDQQSSRPVQETEESDDGGGQEGQPIVEENLQTKNLQSQQKVDEEKIEQQGSSEPQPGDQVDIRI